MHTIVSFSVTMASACGREETPLPCAPSSRLSAAPPCSSVTRFFFFFFQAVDGCLCLFPSLFAVQRQTKSPPLDPWDAVRLQQVLFWDDTNLWEFSPIVGHVDVDHALHFSCLLFSYWIWCEMRQCTSENRLFRSLNLSQIAYALTVTHL